MARRLIEIKPEVMMGKPMIAGTRITVELILEKLAAGETMEQIVEALRAAGFGVAYAAQTDPAAADELPGAFSVLSPGLLRIRNTRSTA